MIVSYFESAKGDAVNHPTHLHPVSVLKKMREKHKHYNTLVKIRESNDKEEIAKLKLTLPVVLYHGKFLNTTKEGFVEPSSLLTLDFDEGDIPAIRKKFEQWPYTYAAFTGPSGGDVSLKVLVKIFGVKDDEEFKRVFAFFEEKYPMLDKSGKNINRSCFISYDPNTYINENAKVFTKEMLGKYGSRPKPQTDIKLLNTIADWIRHAPKGQRNYECCKSAYYAGGLISSGQLEENIAYKTLELAAIERGGEIEQSKTAIKESIEAGKRQPILNMQELERKIRSMTKKVDPKNFLISAESIDEEAEMYYEGTYGDSISTGLSDFDYWMSFRKNSFEFLVGGSKAGKTTLKLYLNTYLAVHHGLKTMAVCFENSAMEVQDEVIGFLTGNSAKYVYQTNRALYNKAKDFFKEHFAMLKVPPDMDFIALTETCAQLNSQSEYFELWIDPIFKLPGTDDYAGNKLVARYAEPFANDVMGLFISMHARSSAQRDGGHIKDTDADFGVMYGNAADMTMAISRDFRDHDSSVRNTVLMSIDRIRSKKLKGGMETVKDCPIKWEYQWKEHNYDLWVPQPDDPDTYVRHKGGLLPRGNKSLF